MISRRQIRNLCLTFVVLFAASACSQDGVDNSGSVQAAAYLDVAELYYNQGQFRAAIIELQNALQASPGFREALSLSARIEIDLGNQASAQAGLQQLLQTYPADSELSLMLAESYINTGNLDQASDLLEALESTDNNQNAQKQWLLGNIHARNGNQTAAYESLQSALELNPNHIASLISLSILEFQGGNEFGAQDYLDQATAADPDDLDLWLWRGQYALLQERYLESEEAYSAALQIMGSYDIMTPKRLSALRAIIIPLQMQQKNDQALVYSEIIAETPQGQLQNTFNSAVSLFQEGNIEQAEAAINDVLAVAPEHAGSNILMGLVQYSQGNFQAAEQSLSGLVDAESSSPEVLKVYAASQLRLGQAERALSVLQDAYSNYPEDGSLLAMMAITQQALGEIEQSVDTFNRAMELVTDSPDLHFALASSHAQLGDQDSAIEELNRTLEINSNYDQAKNALVELYLNNDSVDAAAAATMEWLEQDPQSLTNNNLAGRVAYRQENVEAAREYFEASLGIDETNADAKLFLATIDVAEENYADAEARILQVLETQPQNMAALSGILTLGDLDQSQSQKIAQVQQIIDEQQSEFVPPLVLSQYFLSKNNLEDAMTNAQLAYSRNANQFSENLLMTVLLRQVGSSLQQQDIEGAREAVFNALGIQPENLQALILAAGVETEDGNYAAAQDHLDRVKSLRPEGSSIGIEAEGDFQYLQGNLEAALGIYREAWDLAPTSSVGAKLHRTFLQIERGSEASEFLLEWDGALPGDPVANLLLGMDYQGQNNENEAIDRYEITIQQQPDNIVALNNLAWLYQDSNPERAIELSTRAAELYQTNADVLDTHGWILLKQGRRDEAIAVLERALELAPDSQAIEDHLEAARR